MLMNLILYSPRRALPLAGGAGKPGSQPWISRPVPRHEKTPTGGAKIKRIGSMADVALLASVAAIFYRGKAWT